MRRDDGAGAARAHECGGSAPAGGRCLTDAATIRALAERSGFRFSKALGQNFLRAAWVPARIAAEAGPDRETGVLEVGPGVGCLTAELAGRAKRVLAVELDRRLAPLLAETLDGLENVELLFADVLKLDLPALVEARFGDCARVMVCANLPYQITTPVLTAFVRAGCFSRLTVMLQKEVAARICAAENTPEYGAFSVLMQWHMLPELLFDVPPSCFLPPPKVTSSVLRLTPRTVPPAPVADAAQLQALVRAAFQQRRKTLCNALCHGLGRPREEVLAALAACGLDARVRGEALSLAQFAALSDALGG